MQYKFKISPQNLSQFKQGLIEEMNEKINHGMNAVASEMIHINELAINQIKNSPEFQSIRKGGPLPLQPEGGEAVGVIGLEDRSDADNLLDALRLGVGSRIERSPLKISLLFGDMEVIKQFTPLPSANDTTPPSQGKFSSWALQLHMGELQRADLKKLEAGSAETKHSRTGFAIMINKGIGVYTIFATNFLEKYFDLIDFEREIISRVREAFERGFSK